MKWSWRPMFFVHPQFHKGRGGEGVCDATSSDSTTSCLQSDLQNVQQEGESQHSHGQLWVPVRKEFRLWLNMIAEGKNEMFQSYSDHSVEADDLYAQNSAHLKMSSFEKYYPEHEGPWRQTVWIVSPLTWRNPSTCGIIIRQSPGKYF
jgi:hypothetical protein